MKRKAKRRSSSLPVPLILIAIGALLVLGVLIWQVVRSAPTPTTAGQEIPVDQIDRVNLDEAKQAFDEQSAVFLDVRAPESFSAGHIPGSINIPLAQLENRLSELDPNQWIIPYCT